MEKVWSTRRNAVSYPTQHEHDEDNDDEVKSTDSASKCKRCKGCVYRFFRSMGFTDEDELFFIHTSWELLERGTGRFSTAIDYLVYRSFYALIITGLVLYAVAVKSNDLETYPVLLYGNAGIHILYSMLYTLHIVTGKTHQAKVEQTEDVEGQLEEHLDGSATHPAVPLAQLGSFEDLTTMDIQNTVMTKPHPITTPDRVIWLLFNIFASVQIGSLLVFLTGYGRRRGIERDKMILDLVFIVYGSIATLADLCINCLPLRIIHCIYPVTYLWVYALYTYLEEHTTGKRDIGQQDWTNHPAGTAIFIGQASALTIIIHIFICGVAYCRNKVICIFSKEAKASTLGRHAEVLNELIQKNTSVKRFVNSPNFHQAFEEEQNEELRLAKIKEEKEARKKARALQVFEKGTELFQGFLQKARDKFSGTTVQSDTTTVIKPKVKASRLKTAYRPYSSDMTIGEFVDNLAREPNDGIIRAKKPEMKGGPPPDFDWVAEKRKEPEKIPISGIKKEVKARKWDEFYTPPDSLQELTLKTRHRERGRGRNYAKLETYNDKLSKVPHYHHVMPGPLRKALDPEDLETRKRKPSNDSDDGKDDESIQNSKSRSTTARRATFRQDMKDELKKKTIKGPPKRVVKPSAKAGNSVVQGRDNVTKRTGQKSNSKPPAKSTATGAPRMSTTGIKVHENWINYVPPKPVNPPQLKWYLGDSSYMPEPPRPPTPPFLPPSPSIHLDKKTLLENEKAELEKTIKEKLKSNQVKEKIRDLRIRQSIRQERVNHEKEMQRRETEISATVGPSHYAVSEYVRTQSKRMELREARLLARKKKYSRPHFIALNINKKPEISEEQALIRQAKFKLQEEKSRRLAYEDLKKPRPTMIFEDSTQPSRQDKQLIPLLLLHVDEKTKHEILNKPSQGILKNKDNKDDYSITSSVHVMPGLEKVSPALVKRDLRSNLQLHGRAHARGPMAESVYHPLKLPTKGTTEHQLTYHYLDDKLPHTGGARAIEESDLEHYHHHPGTHVHHPMLNLEHSEGPHKSLGTALKEHVSTKVKQYRKHRYMHPALEPVKNVPAEVPNKDAVHENPFRVVAFHPIVQFRSVQEKRPSEPAVKPKVAPKLKEIYPRDELRKLKEDHSDDSVKSEVVGGGQGPSEKKKPHQLKDLLAGPLKPPAPKPKKPS